jgi:cobalamin-dependent methionine synthase I
MEEHRLNWISLEEQNGFGKFTSCILVEVSNVSFRLEEMIQFEAMHSVFLYHIFKTDDNGIVNQMLSIYDEIQRSFRTR